MDEDATDTAAINTPNVDDVTSLTVLHRGQAPSGGWGQHEEVTQDVPALGTYTIATPTSTTAVHPACCQVRDSLSHTDCTTAVKGMISSFAIW